MAGEQPGIAVRCERATHKSMPVEGMTSGVMTRKAVAETAGSKSVKAAPAVEAATTAAVTAATASAVTAASAATTTVAAATTVARRRAARNARRGHGNTGQERERDLGRHDRPYLNLRSSVHIAHKLNVSRKCGFLETTGKVPR
jgi:hypothetical protein